jgi:hypothetical protein
MATGDPYYNPYFIDFLHRPDRSEYALKDQIRSPMQMGLQAFLLSFPHPYEKKTVNGNTNLHICNVSKSITH